LPNALVIIFVSNDVVIKRRLPYFFGMHKCIPYGSCNSGFVFADNIGNVIFICRERIDPFLNTNQQMYVVWHNDPIIEFDIGVMRFYIEKLMLCNVSNLRIA